MSDNVDAAREMPRYECHKQVWALKIAKVVRMLGAVELIFDDEGYAPIKCGTEMMARYMPVPGDYYVQYADGYKSISPAKAFEEGYTRIE